MHGEGEDGDNNSVQVLGTRAMGRVEIREQRQASSKREMGLERIRSV